MYVTICKVGYYCSQHICTKQGRGCRHLLHTIGSPDAANGLPEIPWLVYHQSAGAKGYEWTLNSMCFFVNPEFNICYEPRFEFRL